MQTQRSAKRAYGSGSIREHATKSGQVILYGRWRRPDGTRRQVALGPKRTRGEADGLTRAMAEATLRAAIEADREEYVQRPVRRGRLLEGVCQRWLDHLRDEGAAPTYVQDVESALKHHVRPFFGDESPVDSITRERVKAFRDHLASIKSSGPDDLSRRRQSATT